MSASQLSEIVHDNMDSFLPTRWSLVSRLKDWDDQASWREFFDVYWRLIYQMALKSGLGRVEAEEVVQEVIISVAKNIAEFKAEPARGSFKGWLLNMTRWRITDQLRKRAREQAVRLPRSHDATATDTATVEKLAHPADLEAIWQMEWERNLIEVALERVKARVKPEMFQMFDLLVTKRWPARKIARRLKVSLTQVYYAKCKVSALLKIEVRKLEKKGI